RLGPGQRAALIKGGRNAAAQSAAATDKLRERFVTLGFEPETLERLRAYLRREAPLWINFSPARNGLLTSEVYQPRGHGNASWAQPQGTPSEMGVIYGWANAQKSPGGYLTYGHAALTLENHVRARVTLVPRHIAGQFDAVGTLHALDHVLLAMSDVALRQYEAASRGDKMARPTTDGVETSQEILETHVHGPLGIAQDVRKVTALGGHRYSADELRGLTRFAARNGKPLRWRGLMGLTTARRAQEVSRLTAANCDVALWLGGQGPKDPVVLQPGKLSDGGTYRYELHEDDIKGQRRLVDTLGRRGFEIVGYDVDAPSNQAGQASERAVRLLVRQNSANPGPHGYAVYRTQALRDRLDFLERGGYEVCAYQATRADGSPTAEHLLIARHGDRRFEHELVIVPAGIEVERLRNHVAARAVEGWRVGGGCTVDGNVHLVFKRAVAASPEEDRATNAEATPWPYHNDTTMLGDELQDLPASLLFTTEDGYAFDVDELVDLIEEKGVMRNPWTGKDLSEADIGSLVLHPSGAGVRVSALVGENDAMKARLSAATGAMLQDLATVLLSEPTTGAMASSTGAVAGFSEYVKGLPRSEQVALAGARFQLRDTHGNAFAISVLGAIAGLQSQAGCSRATGRYLQTMAEQILEGTRQG
ncbi:MAG TPA: hypothetical protein VFH51_20900, partial [Myxococcota bacterium]|nr:hypothetical protein [Myxococcota bacterium]